MKTTVSMWSLLIACALAFLPATLALGQKKQAAFKIGGKTMNIGDLEKDNKGAFYEIESKRFELIENIAQEKYLEYFWQKLAKEKKKSVDEVRKEYLDKNVTVSDAEVKENAERYKDSPQLAKLPPEKREEQVREVLKSRAQWTIMSQIVRDAKKSGDLVLMYPKPEEPVIQLKVKDTDQVRFGPEVTDIQPIQCKGDDCPVTIVEYSEFQCPYCGKVVPDTTRIMTEYKGKIRWVMRDFPLTGHDRAKPAAVAAHCAGDQGKYWAMYKKLFENQRNLADSDLEKFAKDSGVDMGKWNECVKKKETKEAIIDENFQSGA